MQHTAPSRPRVLAHRGSSARWPEHSRAAYVQALADGADGLECDVRLTADGVPVCWHDADVDRTSDGTGPVHAHTVDQMLALDVMAGSGTRAGQPRPAVPGSGPQVLTLADLVDLARGAGRPVHLAIELKHPSPYGFAAEDAVLALLDAAGWDRTAAGIGLVTVSLMSFHPGSLEHLASRGVPRRHLMVLLDHGDIVQAIEEHAPGSGVNRLVVTAVRRLVARANALVEAGEVGGVGPSLALVRQRPQDVERWLAAGRLVRVWTVDEPADLELCRQVGVDEVTSNVPDRLLRLLGR